VKKKRKAKFRVGQRVRVAVRGRPYAIISRKIREGGVVLDRLIHGFACWNEQDLRPLTRREKGDS